MILDRYKNFLAKVLVCCYALAAAFCFSGVRAASAVEGAGTTGDARTTYTLDTPSDWAVPEVEKAREYGLIPEDLFKSFKENISRQEFCRLAMALYTKITGNKSDPSVAAYFTDTDNIDILNAYHLGIVKGTGNNMFSPERAITRQEIAVMLCNTITAISKDAGKNILQNNSPALVYIDQRNIENWARTEVALLSNNDIMFGDDAKRFNPEMETPREQAFALSNRIYLIYARQSAKPALPQNFSGEIMMSIKGSFLSDNIYNVIGDVQEYLPSADVHEIDRYLTGKTIEYDNAIYTLDPEESLNESLFLKYSFDPNTDKYYRLYVFYTENSAKKIHLVDLKSDGVYSFISPETGLPLTENVFAEVTLAVVGDAHVILSDGKGSEEEKTTYAELIERDVNRLYTHRWMVVVVNGKVTALTRI